MNSLSTSTLISPSSSPLLCKPSSLKPRTARFTSSPFPIQAHLYSSISTTPQNSYSKTLTEAETLGLRVDSKLPFDSLYSPSSSAATDERGGGADTDAMGLLLRERIIFLGYEIDDFVADAIISQLLLLDAQNPKKDIRLFINSPGGSLSATMAIYDVLQLVRADVSTIGLGIAASTSAIILGGGTKGKRLAMPNTRIMIHQPMGGASGEALDVAVQAAELMKNKESVINVISEFSGRTPEQVEKDIRRDRYMSPMEAVEYGLLDGVIDRDSIIPLVPMPDTVIRSRLNIEEMMDDPKKFLTPDVPDDEIV